MTDISIEPLDFGYIDWNISEIWFYPDAFLYVDANSVEYDIESLDDLNFPMARAMTSVIFSDGLAQDGCPSFTLNSFSTNTIRFALRNEYLIDYISIATSNYGEYQTDDFRVKLIDIYDTVSECPNVDNDAGNSGQLLA